MLYVYNQDSQPIVDLHIETTLNYALLHFMLSLAIYDNDPFKKIIPNNLQIIKLKTSFRIIIRDMVFYDGNATDTLISIGYSELNYFVSEIIRKKELEITKK